jgi:hypothetical protein
MRWRQHDHLRRGQRIADGQRQSGCHHLGAGQRQPGELHASGHGRNLKIIIDSPDASTAITSPVQVSGTASVDKGTVVAVVLDAAGNELGRATATASAVKPDYGHYDVTVTFTGGVAGQKGQIKVFGVSPRDGTTPTSYYFIQIKFG